LLHNGHAGVSLQACSFFIGKKRSAPQFPAHYYYKGASSMFEFEGFGKRVQALRKQKSMTQDDLAARLNVTPQAVSKWDDCVKQGLTKIFG
jgi:hypothetical protein